MDNWILALSQYYLTDYGNEFKKSISNPYPVQISWFGRIPTIKNSQYLLSAVRVSGVKVPVGNKNLLFVELADISVTHTIVCLQKNSNFLDEIEPLFEFQLATKDEVAIGVVNFLASCMNACGEKDCSYLTERRHQDYWFRLASIEAKRLDADVQIWEIFEKKGRY